MASARSMRPLLRFPPCMRARAHTTAAPTTTSLSGPGALPPPWGPSRVLDEWVAREARPISLRQLTFFGRTLTEKRLVESANYVRVELPTRIAHRLRNIQMLPYAAVTNQHISRVYALYYSAFERFRKVPEVRTLADNHRFCETLKATLSEHLAVIPQLAMGILEIQDSVSSGDCDRFMINLLRSRISRRTIAEQHLALTDTFHSPWHLPAAQKSITSPEDEFVGQIFLKCNAKEVVAKCAATARDLCAHAYGPSVKIPDIVLQGHLDTTFPYIPSHLEYIIGELLRNSIQASVEQRALDNPPPIEVLICGTAQHAIIRVSDQGGGIDRDVLPYLWSFAKGPRRKTRLHNLGQVPKLAGTMQELRPSAEAADEVARRDSSLSRLSERPPDLKLGLGLPMSKIYAEYWAGTLEVHSLEGYGCDAFLQINRLGNQNEKLSTRAAMDAL